VPPHADTTLRLTDAHFVTERFPILVRMQVQLIDAAGEVVERDLVAWLAPVGARPPAVPVVGPFDTVWGDVVAADASHLAPALRVAS
jgi:hypothetical protein